MVFLDDKQITDFAYSSIRKGVGIHWRCIRALILSAHNNDLMENYYNTSIFNLKTLCYWDLDGFVY